MLKKSFVNGCFDPKIILLSALIIFGYDMNVMAKSAVFELSFEADKEVVTIGDEIHVAIDVLHSSDFELLDLNPKLAIKPFEIKSIQRSAATIANRATNESFDLILTIFELGEYQIPKLPIEFKKPDGTKGTVYTDVWPIKVVSVRPNTDPTVDIHDLKGQKKLPLDPEKVRQLWIAGLSIVSALLLIGLIFFGVRKYLNWRKNRMPPYEKAMAKLNALGSMPLQDADQIRIFYTDLSHLLREYFRGQFKFGSVEWTTQDYQGQVYRSFLLEREANELMDLLKQADLVKFAKLAPDVEKSQQYLANAKTIVEESKIRFDAEDSKRAKKANDIKASQIKKGELKA